MAHLQNAEFQNLKLAQIYEVFNQFSDDEDFWVTLIRQLDIHDITDFGCGTGLFTHKLMKLGYKVRGIEPAKSMLLQAKKKEDSDKIEYIEGDYRKLENFSTDLILMTSHVAQFIGENEWENFLQKSYGVLKNGGYILFDSKNPLPKPWENYTREKYNKTKQTPFGGVNMQIENTNTSGNTIEHTIYYRFEDTGEELVSKNTLIYRNKDEVEKSLMKIGFKIVKIYGGWDYSEYSEDSEEMIFLFQKTL